MNTTPTPKAGKKKRDRALFARLIESYQADRVGIFVDFDRLNHPRSPVWNPWENIAHLLVITLNHMSKTRCVAPDGDWRAFVTRYLPEMELEGAEIYNAFRQGGADDEKNKGNERPSKFQDVHM